MSTAKPTRDTAGLLATSANSGAATVDVAIASADFGGLTIDGRPVPVSGSSYSAAWLARLAAMVASRTPVVSAAGLKAILLSQAVPASTSARPDPGGIPAVPFTRHGVIPATAATP